MYGPYTQLESSSAAYQATYSYHGQPLAGRNDSSTLLSRSPSLEARRMVRFPEKRELILLTDRAPQLETPLHYFRQDFTPNEAFFVRWHVAGIPNPRRPSTRLAP